MKTLILSFAAVLSLISTASASGDIRMDCRIGDDGIGGKYCHYQLSQCANISCDEAAKCAVEKVAYDRQGRKVRAHQSGEATPVVRDGEEFNLHQIIKQQLTDCNAKACLEPLHVLTKQSIVSPGKCEPVAIQ